MKRLALLNLSGFNFSNPLFKYLGLLSTNRHSLEETKINAEKEIRIEEIRAKRDIELARLKVDLPGQD